MNNRAGPPPVARRRTGKPHVHSPQGVREYTQNSTPNFTEGDVTWVASKISGAAGALGSEVTDLLNWLLCFGCASYELRVVLTRMADWMAYSSPPWAAYCALMACRLVSLDKRLGVRPVSVGETFCRALAKRVVRAARDQAKTACGNLQMCAGLKAGIEGSTHAVGQQRLERMRVRQGEEEEADNLAEKEEERGGVAGLLNNLTIEKAVMKE